MPGHALRLRDRHHQLTALDPAGDLTPAAMVLGAVELSLQRIPGIRSNICKRARPVGHLLRSTGQRRRTRTSSADRRAAVMYVAGDFLADPPDAPKHVVRDLEAWLCEPALLVLESALECA